MKNKKKVHRPGPEYSALHRWVRKFKSKVALCVCCKVSPPVDLANISGKYKKDVNDFEWLCRRCHMTKDGRAKIFASMASHQGVNHSRSKLTERQVLDIRKDRKLGFTYSKIAKLYGMSISRTAAICTGDGWKHLIGKRKPNA